MQLTNGEIFNAKAPLEKLLQQRFPVKTSFALAKLAQKLNEQLIAVEQVRQGLFQTYGKPDSANMRMLRVEPGSENWPKFNEEMGELFSQEVGIVIEPVTLPEMVASTCEKCGHNMDKAMEIEPATLMVLEKFIKV